MTLFEKMASMEHEQVVFCSDPGSGLRSIIAVHDTTLVNPLLQGNAEWKDYAAPLPELNPALSVIWVRKGETDTAAAIDKVVQGWHRSGWLIATEKPIEIAAIASDQGGRKRDAARRHSQIVG